MAKFSKTNQPEKNGRHKLAINADSVHRLALIHCTIPEIAAVLKCAESTITGRFMEALRKGHEHGQMSIKRKMHEKAFAGAGDTTMLIWLSKQRLGYKERQPDEATQINFNVFINEVPK